MSQETFDYHYGKHHAGYVQKLNAAVEGTDYADMELEAVIETARSKSDNAVFNNAAQHFNHSFFWECLSSEGGEAPDVLASELESAFGSFDEFETAFKDAAKTLFGSGWVWLVKDSSGVLKIETTSNADTPVGLSTPLLVIDVWEHAYYIDHRNDRGAYVEAFWKYIDWKKVADRL